MGFLEYYLRPRLASGFGVLNGQQVRRRLVETLLRDFEVSRIVETGTFRGATTEWFAGFGLPVWSVETNARYLTYSRLRLERFANVSLHHAPSAAFLREQVARGSFRSGRTFFYLDAHWERELPLGEELLVILGGAPSAIVMVDDFEVPGDPGYGFHDQGPGGRIGVDYLAALPLDEPPHVFLPATPSAAETGARRGAAVVTGDEAIAGRLAALPELRRFDPARRFSR